MKKIKEIENLRNYYLKSHIYDNDYAALQQEFIRTKILCENKKLSNKDRATLDYIDLCIKYYLFGEDIQGEGYKLIDQLVKIGHIKSIHYRINLLDHYPADEKMMLILTKQLRAILDRAPMELKASFRQMLAYNNDLQSKLMLTDSDCRLMEKFYSALPQRVDEIMFGETPMNVGQFTVAELKGLSNCINEILTDHRLLKNDNMKLFKISNRLEVRIENCHNSMIDFYFKRNILHSIAIEHHKSPRLHPINLCDGVEDLMGIQTTIYKIFAVPIYEKAHSICFIDELPEKESADPARFVQ